MVGCVECGAVILRMKRFSAQQQCVMPSSYNRARIDARSAVLEGRPPPHYFVSQVHPVGLVPSKPTSYCGVVARKGQIYA